MKEDQGAPLQPVTVTSDRVVTLTTRLATAESLPQTIMQAERSHKEAWRRLAHQPGVTLGAVVDVRAWRLLVEALRPGREGLARRCSGCISGRDCPHSASVPE